MFSLVSSLSQFQMNPLKQLWTQSFWVQFTINQILLFCVTDFFLVVYLLLAVDSKKDEECVVLNVVTSDQNIRSCRAPIADTEVEFKTPENEKEEEKKQQVNHILMYLLQCFTSSYTYKHLSF